MQASAEREFCNGFTTAHRLAVQDGLNEGMWSHLYFGSPDDLSGKGSRTR